MVIRVDDVNPNTDFEDFYDQLQILQEFFDEIILGVNIFAKSSNNGALYPELPLRGHEPKYFYNVDRMLSMDVIETLSSIPKVKIVSHGLIHGMHSQMSREAIEMSILTSCSFLGTKTFIPPFNEMSATGVQVCEENGIEIIGNYELRQWHSLETEIFDSKHKLWYYHPWRIKADELSERLYAPSN